MSTFTCGVCDESLSVGAHCSVCNQVLHFHCVGLTESGFKKLGDRRHTWRCTKCKVASSNLPTTSHSSEPESLILKEIRAINEKLTPLESLKDEISQLRSEFTNLKSSLDVTNKELIEFNSKIQNIESHLTQVEKVQGQVDIIHTRLDKIEEEHNAKEQWTRLNNVEIKGLPQSNHENLFDIISKIGAKIHYSVSKAQINFIARVPTREKDHAKPIIVCFCNRYVKEDFIAAARLAFKTAPLSAGQIGLPGHQRIFINDHLTIQNKTLLSKTKKMATDMGFQYVWVKHSKIHARKSDTSPTIVLKSEKDLLRIK